ncbi:MAG: nucleotidyl transferase AbiEii/AbiGii toxin family protein [Patescibacteria group bacterium]|nr:nucleotidyl transferase AbiEii/AbiGii toxin family protein [Patescibacteria group bacterium]
MIVPRAKDIKHKYYMLRLLRAVLTDKYLPHQLQFKGGTYAALRGLLDRFSVDLDFDLPEKTEIKKVRERLNKIFDSLGLVIKDESREYLQFFLEYPAIEGERNTLKLEINDNPSIKNIYEKVNLPELKMYCSGHNPGTMTANKLAACTARFDRTNKIAGRDFYDLHYFLLAGMEINKLVVEDLTGMSYVKYLRRLIKFIENKVNERLLLEDLNPLIETGKLKQLKLIKPELSGLLNDEIKRG